MKHLFLLLLFFLPLAAFAQEPYFALPNGCEVYLEGEQNPEDYYSDIAFVVRCEEGTAKYVYQASTLEIQTKKPTPSPAILPGRMEVTLDAEKQSFVGRYYFAGFEADEFFEEETIVYPIETLQDVLDAATFFKNAFAGVEGIKGYYKFKTTTLVD